MSEDYANIREQVGMFVGDKIVDITQHDEDHFKATGQSFVDLMFESGNVLRFIWTKEDGEIMAVNPGDEEGDKQ
jgi:hypothetical protein